MQYQMSSVLIGFLIGAVWSALDMVMNPMLGDEQFPAARFAGRWMVDTILSIVFIQIIRNALRKSK